MPELSSLLEEAKDLFDHGRFSEAERKLRRGLSAATESPDSDLLLGKIYCELGRMAEAETRLRRVIGERPDAYEALEWLARVLGQTNRIDEAIDLCDQAIRLRPEEATGHNTLGLLHLSKGQLESGLKSLKQAVDRDPSAAYMRHNLGNALNLAGRWQEALGQFKSVVDLLPRDERGYIVLGETLLQHDKVEEAIQHLTVGEAAVGASAQILLLLAMAYARSSDAELTEATYRRSLEIDASAANSYGYWLQESGRVEESFAYFDRSLKENPIQGTAYYGLLDQRAEPDEEVLRHEKMRALVNEPRLPEKELLLLFYALGKAYDRARDFRMAMYCFDQANEMAYRFHGEPARFDPQRLRETDDTTLQRFDAATLERLRGHGSDSGKPLFIVGMIRSGTSLLEQILSAHSMIGAGGERAFWIDESFRLFPYTDEKLIGAEISDLAGRYLADLESVQPAAAIVTDKMPLNFGSLGLIALALPNARIVHIRRNPIDTCLSIYMTYLGSGPPFAYKRENIVVFYCEYLRMMEHWRTVLPAGLLIEIDYEDLVSQPEPTTRRLLESLHLEWEDACLHPEANRGWVKTPSRWQTRQPIYTTSTGRWRRYEPWLGPFADMLPQGDPL